MKEVAMRLQGSCNVPKSKKTRWDHAKSRSGKSKTKAQGRPNWRHRAAAVLEAKMQEELRAEWAEMVQRGETECERGVSMRASSFEVLLELLGEPAPAAAFVDWHVPPQPTATPTRRS